MNIKRDNYTGSKKQDTLLEKDRKDLVFSLWQ